MLSNQTSRDEPVVKAHSARRHYPMVVAVVCGGMAVGAPWLVVAVPTGASSQASWGDVAPASLSLALAAVAAWGATLLVSPTATRILGVVQMMLASTGLWFLVTRWLNPSGVVDSLSDKASGVVGAIDPETVQATWAPGWGAMAGLAMVAVVVSGLWSALAPGSPRRDTSQYEPQDTRLNDDPWQALDNGGDPTAQ